MTGNNWAVEITGISKSIDVERLTSERSTLLGIGTRQYVKVVFYVDLNQNRRKVKVKGVYVDVINIYVRISSADGQNLDTKRRWDYGNVHQVHIIIWIMTALEID